MRIVKSHDVGPVRHLDVHGIRRHDLVKLDEANGQLAMDTAFHDADGKPGFNFDNREWPHGWKGSANPHGVVFSR